uniref:Uncharacterized protein n=1 Tax=Solanum lycopersicum TaxID=4081 RepID=A0A3Q7JV80_SOLLC
MSPCLPKGRLDRLKLSISHFHFWNDFRASEKACLPKVRVRVQTPARFFTHESLLESRLGGGGIILIASSFVHPICFPRKSYIVMYIAANCVKIIHDSPLSMDINRQHFFVWGYLP